ncbi:MAG: TRAP transporter small permease [Bacteroidota bacterium]
MKTREKINKVLEKLLAVLLGVMVVNVLWQVASRYILGSPSIFTDELARYLLIWLGLIGAAYGTGRGLHVSIDLLKQKLTSRQQYFQFKIISVLMFLFALAVLVLGGTRMVLISFELGQTSSAMHLPIGFVYLALPISGVLICYYTIHNLTQKQHGAN